MSNHEDLRRMQKTALAIEGDDGIRAKKCAAAINDILAKYDSMMIPQLMISPGNVDGTVAIAPKPREKPS